MCPPETFPAKIPRFHAKAAKNLVLVDVKTAKGV